MSLRSTIGIAATALLCAAPAWAKNPNKPRTPPGAKGAAYNLDQGAMAALHCVVKPEQLKPMPARIGQVALPAGVAGSLRLIFSAKRAPSGSLQAPPAYCADMQPKYFVQGAGKGSVTSAVVAMVVKPIVVWRAWADKKPYCYTAAQNGRWWSFGDPRELGKAAYRRKNAICESWNTLGKVTRCTLKPGTALAIGPTESVTKQTCRCAEEQRAKTGDHGKGPYDPTLPAWAGHDSVSKRAGFAYDQDLSVLQVFVNTDPHLKALTSHCEDFTWHTP